jgi:hypothetical protein
MKSMPNHHYRQLSLMMVLSFASMYILMYAMVDTFPNVFPNANQFYMAGLMTAPMLIIELGLMETMYHKKRLNTILLITGMLALAGFMFMIRTQALIGDKQFLKSMIPHHAGAILMCQRASIEDPEIKELCRTIILNQQAEIDQMKKILESK